MYASLFLSVLLRGAWQIDMYQWVLVSLLN